MFSIKLKLFIQTVAVVLAMALFAGVSAVWVTVSDYRQQAEKRLDTYVAQIRQELDIIVHDMDETLKSESADPEVLSQIKTMSLLQKENFGDSSEELMLNTQMRIIEHLRQTLRNKGFDLVAFYLGGNLSAYSDKKQLRLVVTRPNNLKKHITPVDPSTPVRFDDHLWKKILPKPTVPPKLESPKETTISFTLLNEELFVEGDTPIKIEIEKIDSYETSQVIAGTLKFRKKIDNDLLENRFKTAGLPVDLFNKDGLLIASSHPDQARINQQNVLNLLADHKDLVSVERSDGGFYAWIRPYLYRDLRVVEIVAYMPRDIVIRNARRIIFLLLGGLTAGVVLAGIFAFLTGRFITHPVTEVAEQMRDIAATKDFGRRVPLKSADEVGVLAKSFNEMSRELESADIALRVAERKYRTIFENAIEGIFQMKEEGAIITANPALARMFGFPSPAEMLSYASQSTPELFDDPEMSCQLIDDLKKHKILADLEIGFKRLDGSVFIGLVHARLSTSPSDKDLIAEGSILDITARKENELAVQQREAAEAASRAKSKFLAHMSHEIRTPINAVIGLSHLTLQTDLTARQQDYLEKISQSTQLLLGIINDLLDFSKVEAGMLKLEEVSFDLNEVLDNMAVIVSMGAGKKDLEIIFQHDSQLPGKMIGDPIRLGQVLTNLTTNAVKFTNEGEIIITTTLIYQNDKTTRVGFSVKDTGIGIHQEELDTIFQPFHQIDDSFSRRYEGSGLGLPISKQLVELMGGTLKAKSVFGKGSQFYFDTIFGLAEDGAESERFLFADDVRITQVLLVDDNTTARDVLRSMLEDFGLSVEATASGEHAIELVKQRIERSLTPYDLVLLDWNIQGLSGLETTSNIMAIPEMEKVPIILLTPSCKLQELKEAAQKIRSTTFLTKPVLQVHLFDAILEAVGHRKNTTEHSKRSTGRELREINAIAGKKILVVEDNPINRQVLSEILERFGMVVEAAENGLEAVELVKENLYDLVLMDIQMPELDGLEATRILRNYGFSDLPIVAITAHAMTNDHEKSVEAGMNDHLSKPVDPKELATVLLQWIPADNTKNPALLTPENMGCNDTNPITLPEIEELDSSSGLLFSGDSPELYLKLLKEFVKIHSNDASSLRTLYAAGKKTESVRLAHSIKGAAASLGAKALSEASYALELQLQREDPKKIEESFAHFKEKLQRLCHNLNNYFAESVSKPGKETIRQAASAISPEVILEQFDNLAVLLVEGNSRAVSALDELSDSLTGCTINKEIDEIRNAIEDVEFSQALRLVNRLKAVVREKVLEC